MSWIPTLLCLCYSPCVISTRLAFGAGQRRQLMWEQKNISIDFKNWLFLLIGAFSKCILSNYCLSHGSKALQVQVLIPLSIRGRPSSLYLFCCLVPYIIKVLGCLLHWFIQAVSFIKCLFFCVCQPVIPDTWTSVAVSAICFFFDFSAFSFFLVSSPPPPKPDFDFAEFARFCDPTQLSLFYYFLIFHCNIFASFIN